MSFPLRNGGEGAFQALRHLLERADFTEEAVCRRRSIPSIYDFRTLREKERAGETRPGSVTVARGDGEADPTDLLGVLVHLFMDGEGVARERLEALLGLEDTELLERMGFLRPHPLHPRQVAATALLYPTAGLYIASDLNEDAPGASPDQGRLRSDSVYPAITDAARGFMADLPLEGSGAGEGDQVLDLGAGTGIGALACAGGARHVWAVDITERCTRFAAFNARLNGIENVTALQGDLYEPVADLTFHRIVAHPPYVPSEGDDHIFRDGGEDGERVFRRIVEGLPDHLAPGGLFYARCMATDRTGAPLEERLRGFLGDASPQFHVFVVPSQIMHPARVVAGELRAGRVGAEEAGRRLDRLQRGEVEALVLGTILIQREKEGEEGVVTVRRRRNAQADREDLDWLRWWAVRASRPDAPHWLLNEAPSLREGVQLETRRRVVEGRLRDQSLRVRSTGPFPMAIDLPPEAHRFLAFFNGERTGVGVLELARRRGWIPKGTSEGEWARLLHGLVDSGVLALERAGTGGEAPGGAPTDKL